ncbi:CPBP family intramembrane glutamic endopeptidase [Halobacterium noricense]|uniref:CPBP family intramembrane glutamic endopeptidase n=1 Tax=Halobacterium noricense TaxID=223182 RepID=UPI001E5BA8BA|nr:type II CAAX endopeptidase family protein [Halobacterium noricense]UHH26999.1 CPBP family intramembrane metalloprotease [Halobacterium noricense]
MKQNYAHTVGVVLAGVGLAGTFLSWPATAELTLPATRGFGAVAVLAFTVRRHGHGPSWVDTVATIAAAFLTLGAAAAVIELQTAGSLGPIISLLAGFGALGAGGASITGLNQPAVKTRERRTLLALSVSALALVVGSFLTSVAVSLVPSTPVVRVSVSTAVASIAYAGVGVVFIRSVNSSINVSTLTQRDLVMAAAGILAIFTLHAIMAATVSVFSLPQTSHSLIETAKTTPEILLPLIVLSFVVVAPGEELLARNALQKYLYGAYSRRSAVITASFVFAASHILAYGGTGATPGAILVTLARVFGVALVLGATYEQTDDLFAPVVVHGTYNAVQFAIAYLTFT